MMKLIKSLSLIIFTILLIVINSFAFASIEPISNEQLKSLHSLIDSNFTVPNKESLNKVLSKKIEIKTSYKGASSGTLVSVNANKKEYSLILDTGAPNSIISADMAINSQVKVLSKKINTIYMAWGRLRLYTGFADSINIGGITIKNVMVNVLIDKVTFKNGDTSIPFHGMVGFDLLRKFNHRFDAEQKFFTLTTKDIVQEDFKVFHKVPFTYTRDKIAVTGMINKSIKGQFFLDSFGGGDKLMLSKGKGVEAGAKKFINQITSEKVFDDNQFRLDSFTLGTLHINNPKAIAFGDAIPLSNFDGVVGFQMFLGFNMFFDFKKNLLFLFKN